MLHFRGRLKSDQSIPPYHETWWHFSLTYGIFLVYDRQSMRLVTCKYSRCFMYFLSLQKVWYFRQKYKSQRLWWRGKQAPIPVVFGMQLSQRWLLSRGTPPHCACYYGTAGYLRWYYPFGLPSIRTSSTRQIFIILLSYRTPFFNFCWPIVLTYRHKMSSVMWKIRAKNIKMQPLLLSVTFCLKIFYTGPIVFP